MSEIFTFNKLTLDEIKELVDSSYIFNKTKESIDSEKITLVSFSDERLGSSVEKLDVAVFKDGEWEILDIDKKIEGYNEIPLSYLISSVTYDKVIVVIRRMSTMLLDTKKDGITSYILSVIPEKYRSIEDNPKLLGMLAKNRISLDDSEEMYHKIEKCDTSGELKEWLENVRKEGSE